MKRLKNQIWTLMIALVLIGTTPIVAQGKNTISSRKKVIYYNGTIKQQSTKIKVVVKKGYTVKLLNETSNIVNLNKKTGKVTAKKVGVAKIRAKFYKNDRYMENKVIKIMVKNKEQPMVYSNCYTTKRAQEYDIDYPEFSFNYPNHWKIIEEELNDRYERCVIENQRGTSIEYYQSVTGFGSQYYGGYYILDYARVKKVSDINFKPGYVQATDYSSLGKFSVVKLENYGYEDGQTDKGIVKEKGMVVYAVAPNSVLGEQCYKGLGYRAMLSWKYPSHIYFIAEAPDGKFTKNEEKEVVNILSTFRETNGMDNK